MVQFEGYDRRKDKLEKELAKYGFSSLEEARDLCLSKGVDVESIVNSPAWLNTIPQSFLKRSCAA